MESARISLSIKCRRCDAPIPLNGPWEVAHCDRCQNDTKIPHEFWKDILKDIHSDLRNELEEGEGYNSTIFGTFSTSLGYGELTPYCMDCKTNFDPGQLKTTSDSLTCSKCGKKTPIALAPEWLRRVYPPAKLIVNGFLRTGDGELPAETSRPVVFSCPQCGGALKVNGEDRLTDCPYCEVSVYLPDDLWFRLHPAKVKRRWFVVFKGDPVSDDSE